MIKELAIKHKLMFEVHGFVDTTDYEKQLQAFANEYLALSSSEPVDRSILPIASVIFNENEEYTMLPIGRALFHLLPNVEHSLYLANPLNQQLLTERNAISAWLKDGETVIQRLERERSEVCSMLSMLAEERRKVESVVSERNECVEEIRRLREAMKIARGYANDVDDDYIVGLFDKALSTTDSIKKLLEEVK